MDGIRALVRVAWDLNLHQFAEFTGLDKRDEATKHLFNQVQHAATILRQIDEPTLNRLAQYKSGMVPA